MDQRSAGIRSEIRKLARGRPRTGIRYPSTLRADVVAIARERQTHGVALARIARDLGLRSRTLTLWIRQASRHSLRRVSLVPDPAPTSPAAAPTRPVLVTPRGFRVEGLDLETLSVLLRALA